MKLICLVFSLTAFITVGTHAVDLNFNCYHWTAEDLVAMGTHPSVEDERRQCTSYPGKVFTKGNNHEYPNCGGCWCCQPEAYYKCYHWTAEDHEAFDPSLPIVQRERVQCESHENFVFQGSNITYKRCGGCWCCQPVYECHYWTDEDLAAMGSNPTPEIERVRCEDDLGFLFTQGNNEHFPGTRGCWCIKEKSG